MREQREITERGFLLNAQGELCAPGWSRSLVQEYSRAAIADKSALAMRIKEWDYYLVSNGHFALALTVDDNSYMGLDSISFLALDEGWERTVSPMQAMTLGRKNLPSTSAAGDVHSAGKGYGIHFLHQGTRRTLIAYMKKFGDTSLTARIELTDEPAESMVIATPFDKPGHFYYNQKINCLRASGTVMLGETVYTFSPEDSFAVLDWGRGVWTYENTWYWGSASYVLPDGSTLGWNLGYGFGNTAAASENVVFYNGKAHKLSEVKFCIPGDEVGAPRYTENWKFTSDDGRFEMDFVPQLDRKSCTDVKLIKSDQHQVFGRFTGRVVLDDGTVLEVRDFPGFAEKVMNKW